MATADCVISIGPSVSNTWAKTGVSNCVVFAGVGVAATRVTWAGSAARRESVDWLPRADEMWFDARTGRPTRRFYQFMREVAENRLGGPQGQTVPQVATSVASTQTAVVEAVSFAQQVGQYAQGVAATVQATVEVAQTEGLAGAESIPETPSTPPTYEP